MFDQNPDFLFRLAKQIEAERLREAERNRLPVTRARMSRPRTLKRKLALALAGALLAALLIVQLWAAIVSGMGM